MAKVTYIETTQRTIEIEVSDEQLKALRGESNGILFNLAQDFVLEQAKADTTVPEFVSAICVDSEVEDYTELFEID